MIVLGIFLCYVDPLWTLYGLPGLRMPLLGEAHFVDIYSDELFYLTHF